MADSILVSTKKVLGLDSEYTAFDLDIITHINSAFSTLNQLGLGPAEGFVIEDDSATWDDFFEDNNPSSIKTYVFLKVRLVFDPPTTSYLIDALNKQIEELEWRLNVTREDLEWVNPDPPAVVVDDG